MFHYFVLKTKVLQNWESWRFLLRCGRLVAFHPVIIVCPNSSVVPSYDQQLCFSVFCCLTIAKAGFSYRSRCRWRIRAFSFSTWDFTQPPRVNFWVLESSIQLTIRGHVLRDLLVFVMWFTELLGTNRNSYSYLLCVMYICSANSCLNRLRLINGFEGPGRSKQVREV